MNPSSLYGIIGYPLGHTASPSMHNALFQAYKMKGVYTSFPLKKENLKSFFSCSRFLFRGLNVTVPYKKDVIRFLDETDEHAGFMKSVNTIKNTKGVLKGYNTDFIGLRQNIKSSFGFSLKGKIVSVLGGGGAARSAVYLAAVDGASRVCIINRTVKKAKAIASLLKGKVEIEIAGRNTVKARKCIASSDIIINTTSLGLKKKDPLPMKPEWLLKGQRVLDMIYNPRETRFLASAKKQGCRTANGLSMLIYQGAESFRIWTGRRPDPGIMKKAALKVIF